VPKPLHPLVLFFIGAGSALVGLLPWVITGMRLPLQNLWADQSVTDGMPVALLPFSQYELSFIVALIVVGSTIAGIVARATRARFPRFGMLALVIGVLVVQLVALVQTTVTLEAGLADRKESTWYLAALVAGTVAAIVLGIGMLVLIARAPRAGALVALAVAAIALGSWLGGLFFPVPTYSDLSALTSVANLSIRFAPAIAIGAAIVWAGVGTTGRVVAAASSLLLLWIGPTLVTAVSAAAGTRVLLKYPPEMLEYGVNVFRMAIGMPDLWGPPVLVAAVIAAIGLVGKAALSRRRRSTAM